jgi:UDP-2,4-diacetamido-2,4,6-trideoxy-beta-L-altropyranose hydrolase
MRCLTLAGELRRQGAEVLFISRQLEGHLCNSIERAGFEIWRLPAPTIVDVAHSSLLGVSGMIDAEETRAVFSSMGISPDWLIVDNYALDAHWETLMRPLADHLMVIDDLANRPHNCDLLLDQNLYANMEVRYDGLVPKHCRKLLGPKYALLRPEFMKVRKHLRKRAGNVCRILIFFGGSDMSNETTKALEAVRLLNLPEIAIDVIVGETNPHKEQVRQLCDDMSNTTFYCNVDNMAQMLARSDLTIGAGGSTTWERCCLGVPSIVLSIADNQEAIADECYKVGACNYLGNSNNVTTVQLANEINKMVQRPDSLINYGRKAVNLVDCKGVIRVGEILLKRFRNLS